VINLHDKAKQAININQLQNFKMNNSKIVLFLLCAWVSGLVHAQEFKETINKEIALGSNLETHTLTVHNPMGSVEIEGYEGTAIVMEVEKVIKGADKAQVEKGKRDVDIKVLQKPEHTVVYLLSPYAHYNEQTGSFTYHDNHPENKYDYQLNYKIKVPKQISLKITGLVPKLTTVKNMDSRQINVDHTFAGSIILENVTGQTQARTLNGDITVSYKKNPAEDCTYNTQSGKIDITYQENLSAVLSLGIDGGKCYSSFKSKEPAMEVIPNGEQKTFFQLDFNKILHIGQGGPTLTFWNSRGNVIIRKH
jgi:hypothetical protein